MDGDSTRLIQMFSNVVHNAAKYTHPNGRIRVVLERDGNEAVVRIRDNGQGIRPELLPRVFETFVQDDQSLARSAGGLGIGLALVRRLVELHGGSVSAHSEGAGRGSEFELRLPVVDAHAPASAPQGRAYEPAHAVTKQRVLVVDDNIDLAASTSALLEMWGHESKEVHNGKDVLQLAEAFQPTVILLDIGLPGMDGFEVARSIRARPDLANVYLVAMTGYGQDRDRQNSHQAGFNAHLVKPVQPSALELLLNQLPG